MEGPHFFRAKPLRDFVLYEFPILPVAYSAVRSDPDTSARILQQYPNAEIAKTLVHAVTGQNAVTPPVDSFIGPNPDAAVAALEKGANEIVAQPIVSCVMNPLGAFLSECAVPVGADPESSAPVV